MQFRLMPKVAQTTTNKGEANEEKQNVTETHANHKSDRRKKPDHRDKNYKIPKGYFWRHQNRNKMK